MAEPLETTGPIEPDSLWLMLDLPPPVEIAARHQNKRIVIIGRPLSGKRTLCQHLRLAIEAQFPRSHDTDLENTGSRGVHRHLYIPSASGDDIDNATAASLQSSPSTPPFIGATASPQNRERPHGAGIAHDYVVQRIPQRIQGVSRGGTTRRVVELFCCDGAGALTAALPTPEAIEEALVLIVVDVSHPPSIREQLDRCYDTLNEHLAQVLHKLLPQQDEVRRIELMEKQQRHWTTQEQLLRSLRTQLGATPNEGLVFPGVALEEVNQTAYRAPQGTSCPMRSMIVCTKTDLLERLSRAYADSNEEDYANSAVEDVVPLSLRSSLRKTQLPLLTHIAHLIRQYAVTRRSALAAVSSKIITIAKDSTGGVSLVHPFYRALWNYICYATTPPHETATAEDAMKTPLDVDITSVCTANFFPTALLPIGLDAPGLLCPFIVGHTVQFPLVERGGDAAVAPAGLPSTPEATFKLHQEYLRELLPSQATPPDIREPGGHGDEDLIWDAM